MGTGGISSGYLTRTHTHTRGNSVAHVCLQLITFDLDSLIIISFKINSYTFSLEHNNVRWKIVRTYKEIKSVHKCLSKLVKAAYGVSCSHIPKEKIKQDWPLFPIKNDNLIIESKLSIRCRSIQAYFEKILKFPPYRDHTAVLNFFSVSFLSFLNDTSPSLIEEKVSKRIGERRGTCRRSRVCCETFKLCYESIWLCLKDTYLVTFSQKYNNSISFVMLVDFGFICEKIIKIGAYYCLRIQNLQRTIYIKCKSYQQQLDWFEKINFMLQEPAGKSFKEQTTYNSFAPIRTNQLCKWFLNASAYMENVMYAINHAKEEIFIADWWLCPELYLKRPTDDLQFRLDKILLKKANEGVKIYILLYKEIAIVHDLMSLRTKHVLTEYGKNQNIKVLRHPEHFIDGVF